MLQEARVFNDPQLDPRRCSQVFFASHGLNSIAALHLFFRENNPYVCCVASFSGYYKAFVLIESGRVVHKGSVCFLGILFPSKIHASLSCYL